VNERLSHGAPCFFIQNKRLFATTTTTIVATAGVDVVPVGPVLEQKCVLPSPNDLQATDERRRNFENWLGVFLDTSGLDWRKYRMLEDSFVGRRPKSSSTNSTRDDYRSRPK